MSGRANTWDLKCQKTPIGGVLTTPKTYKRDDNMRLTLYGGSVKSPKGNSDGHQTLVEDSDNTLNKDKGNHSTPI